VSPGIHEWLKEHIRDIPDFPKPGVVFKDITPLLADKKAFAYTIDAIAHEFDRDEIDKVVGIEARGFMVAAPLAYRFTAGLIPVRKKGKLPWETESQEAERRRRPPRWPSAAGARLRGSSRSWS
jgi:adenine phosphoribosyltransferase